MEKTTSKKEVFIQIDKVIATYNKKNPDKKQLNKVELAKILGVGAQVLSDWTSDKKPTPKWAKIVLTLFQLSDLPLEEIITEKNV